jgi:hypothetical protein
LISPFLDFYQYLIISYIYHTNIENCQFDSPRLSF